LLLAAAVSALSALPATGQVAAQQDGRALDANNQVGSGGFNGPAGGGRANGVSQNQIIYGNVTGGKEFRGPIAAPDPGAFFGPSPGRLMDRFVAGSSGVPQPYQPSFSLSNPQPFYGTSRVAPPPPGTYREGFTGAYLGTAQAPQSNLEMSSAIQTDAFRAQPLGQSMVLGTQTSLTSALAQGDLLLQGPLEANNRATLYTGSPLYGIRLYRPEENQTGNEDLTSLYGPSSLYPARADRFRFESAEIQRLRDQLQAEGQNPNNLEVPNNPIPGTPDQQNNTNGPNQQGQPNQPPPLGAPDNPAIDSQVNASANGNPRSTGGLNTGQGVQQRSTLLTPGQQSQQYNELQRRLQRYENPQMAQIEAQHQAQLERQRRANAGNVENNGLPPATQPAGSAPSQGMLRQPGRSSLNPNFQPMRIESMATGMRGTGMRDLLKSGEDLMRQGKFQSAIDKYNVALQAAPNNPLVFLGRANAELGAGFYRQASNDLHQVFLTDRATLMGQYDLKAWMPADRLQFIEKDLKNLAERDSKDEMPVFLLAYISYNTGDAEQAAKYLQQAQERAGQRDPLLELLQSHWKLSESKPAPATPPADLNK